MRIVVSRTYIQLRWYDTGNRWYDYSGWRPYSGRRQNLWCHHPFYFSGFRICTYQYCLSGTLYRPSVRWIHVRLYSAIQLYGWFWIPRSCTRDHRTDTLCPIYEIFRRFPKLHAHENWYIGQSDTGRRFEHILYECKSRQLLQRKCQTYRWKSLFGRRNRCPPHRYA